MGVFPECLIGSLFKKKSGIKIENHKFHRTFYEVKDKPEYEVLLGNIRFSGSPINPYSETLEEALFNFQFAGALSRKNPDLVLYSTTPRFDDSYKNLIQGLDKHILDKLDQFSNEILEKIESEDFL